ncbi:MAG: rhodanese-like domain-containing protein [Chloroflexota bacterium]
MMDSDLIPEVDVFELARKLNAGERFILLDVREGWELDCALINDSRLRVAPLSRLESLGPQALPEDVCDKETEILVMCHHGVRSANVTRWLRKQGWTNVASVRGGIAEYGRLVDGSVGRY